MTELELAQEDHNAAYIYAKHLQAELAEMASRREAHSDTTFDVLKGVWERYAAAIARERAAHARVKELRR